MTLSCINGGVEILPVVATGFLRLVTHLKVFRNPTPLRAAVEFLDGLLAQHDEEWRHCRQLCLDKSLTANDVSEALPKPVPLLDYPNRLISRKLVYKSGFYV